MIAKPFEFVVLAALVLAFIVNTVLLQAVVSGTLAFPPAIFLSLPAGILFAVTEVILVVALVGWIAWMLIPKFP